MLTLLFSEVDFTDEMLLFGLVVEEVGTWLVVTVVDEMLILLLLELICVKSVLRLDVDVKPCDDSELIVDDVELNLFLLVLIIAIPVS